MTVETKLGTLEAKPINDPDYPGIMVGMNYKGQWIEFEWVEVDQWENREPSLKVHVFDTAHDETVYDNEVTIEALDMYKEYMTNGWKEQ